MSQIDVGYLQKSIRPRLCIDISTRGRYLAKEEVYAFLHNFFETQVIFLAAYSICTLGGYAGYILP